MTHTDKQAVQAALDDLHKAKNWKDGKTPAMLPYDFLFHPDGKRKGHFATVKAALEAQIAGGWIPEGWQLVPKEPTDEMIQKGWRKFDKFAKPENRACNMYRAMLEAAPEGVKP